MKRIVCVLALLAATPSSAQQHSHGGSVPQEFGQAAFAAMAEIVALLRADPRTDWTQVDLAALRSHLQDMDALILRSVAEERPSADGLVITIDATALGAEAAFRMVPAHAPVLAAETGWLSTVKTGPDRLIWTVEDPQAAAQIRALGFTGLMAIGNHHPAHHLALASGRDPHVH